VPRSACRVTVIIVSLLVMLMCACLPIADGPMAYAREGTADVTVVARLSGWVARRDGYSLYRDGATVRLTIGVWPNLHGERVRARLEWRSAGRSWRLLDVSTTRLNLDSRGLFLVRGLPSGYSFRIRARVRAGDGHGSGRSRWAYFRVL
jgi:hypothetical protein